MGQGHALFNLWILCGPIVIGLVMGFLVACAFFRPIGFGRFTLGLYFLGLTLFLSAKLSLLGRGTRMSLGSSKMSAWNRRVYRTGYTLVSLALLMTFALLGAIRLS